MFIVCVCVCWLAYFAFPPIVCVSHYSPTLIPLSLPLFASPTCSFSPTCIGHSPTCGCNWSPTCNLSYMYHSTILLHVDVTGLLHVPFRHSPACGCNWSPTCNLSYMYHSTILLHVDVTGLLHVISPTCTIPPFSCMWM